MPLVPSHDPGNHGGEVHSHRFPGANMAVSYANHDQTQMGAAEKFLKSGFITVDIFAVSPVEENEKQTVMVRRASDQPQVMSAAPVGEEAEQSGPAVIREVGKFTAPIDRVGAAVLPGSTVRVDAVVRTRKIGHFFPGGTLDSFDIWLMVGVAASRKTMGLELFARNSKRGKDVNGRQEHGVIEAGAPLLIESTLWTPEIAAELVMEDKNLATSMNAGVYLCNYLSFRALRHFPQKRVGFLHVVMPETISLDEQSTTIAAILETIE